jgi:serine/threonine protein kinase
MNVRSSTFSLEALERAFPEFDAIDPDELAPGGFKAVHHALRAGREVALKIVKDAVGGETTEGAASLPPRVEREIAAMKRLHTPRVVSILDGPATREVDGAGRLWYLEPYYAGGNLQQRLGAEGPWPRDRVLRLYLDLVEAVDEVDKAGLVHRDIKPPNIVFDENGRAVLLDLGIALHVDLLTLTGSSELAPHTWVFAAPEQFDVRRDAIFDARTDLFLVGLTTYFAWTNVHPFRPELPEYVQRLRAGEVDTGPLEAHGDDVLAQAIIRLLKPHLHERFRTPRRACDAVVGDEQ